MTTSAEQHTTEENTWQPDPTVMAEIRKATGNTALADSLDEIIATVRAYAAEARAKPVDVVAEAQEALRPLAEQAALALAELNELHELHAGHVSILDSLDWADLKARSILPRAVADRLSVVVPEVARALRNARNALKGIPGQIEGLRSFSGHILAYHVNVVRADANGASDHPIFVRRALAEISTLLAQARQGDPSAPEPVHASRAAAPRGYDGGGVIAESLADAHARNGG